MDVPMISAIPRVSCVAPVAPEIHLAAAQGYPDVQQVSLSYLRFAFTTLHNQLRGLTSVRPKSDWSVPGNYVRLQLTHLRRQT